MDGTYFLEKILAESLFRRGSFSLMLEMYRESGYEIVSI